MVHKYNIICKGEVIYSKLTEEEYFDKLEELSQDFYINGVPHPEDLKTVILMD